MNYWSRQTTKDRKSRPSRRWPLALRLTIGRGLGSVQGRSGASDRGFGSITQSKDCARISVELLSQGLIALFLNHLS